MQCKRVFVFSVYPRPTLNKLDFFFGLKVEANCAVIVYRAPLMILNPATPGSNPERCLINYKASITAQGLPEPSSLRGSTLGTRAAEHEGCNWGMQVIDGCSLALCSATVSVVSVGICHINKVNSIA